MFALSETIGPLAWTQFWQVTLVALGAGAFAALACRHRPHLAYLVWLVVLAKCLTPPLWSSPTSLFSWLAPHARVGQIDSGRVAAKPVEPILQQPSASPAENLERRLTEPRESTAASNDSPVAAGSGPAPPATAMSLAGILLGMWLAGTIAYAAVALAAVIRWHVSICRGRLLVPEPLAALGDELARRLGIGRKVRLVVNTQPVGPVTYGWLRPTIVLPQALVESRSIDQLRPLVAHELIHVRRGDTLVGILQVVVQAVWWFHPLVRWANRRLSLERERCCDEEVIAALDVPAGRYVEGLLSVLELKISLRIPLGLPGVRRSEITQQRLQHLLSHAGRFQKRTPPVYWLILIAAVLLLVPGAGRTGSAEPEKPKESEPAPAEPTGEKREKPAQAEESAGARRELKVRVTNVRLAAGKEPGSVGLSFTVAEPAGTQFLVEYRQWGVRGAVNTTQDLTVEGESAEVDLKFAYTPDFAGDRNVGVFESSEEDLILRVEGQGVADLGTATIVSAPLWNVDPAMRESRLIEKDSDALAAAELGGRRILLVRPKGQGGQNPDASEPRAEIVVYRYEAPAAKEPTIRQRLINAWSRQEEEIGSAHIQYRHFMSGDRLLAPLSRDEVNKILANADLAKHPENVVSVAKRLIEPGKFKGSLDNVMSRHEFFSAGLNWRVEGERHTEICDGESEFWYSPFQHQLDVYARGSSRRGHTSIRDFRIYFDPGSVTPFEQETLPDGRVRLWNMGSDSQTEWILDPSIGFVERVLAGRPVETSDRFQYGPVNYPGGIIMPTVKIETRYRKGALSYVQILKLDKAEFNDGLPAGAFRMAAKAGTTLVLNTGSSKPRVLTLKDDTNDLAQYLRQHPGLMPEWLMPWRDDVSFER